MPKRTLKAAGIARIKPPAKGQVDYFDQGYSGLALRVSYGGGKSFVYFYRIGGKLRRLTLGPYCALDEGEKEPEPKLGKPLTLKGAHQLWREARDDIEAGRDPAKALVREKAPTDFESVSRDWLKRDQAQNKSKREVQRIVERELIPAWGHRTIGDISRRDVLDLIDGIADRGAVIMARRVHAYVHRLFKWAVGRGIINANPAAELPKPGSETKRDRVLSDDELTAIWMAAGEMGWPFGSVAQLLILTGARREEIGKLRWSEVKANVIELKGDRTKNGEPHTIPLSSPASALIESLPRIAGSDFIFTSNGKSPVSGWAKAKSKLDELSGVTGWRIHDLRRTAATGLQKLGTPLQVTEAILGHTAGSRAGVVSIYQRHDYANEKRSALEAWGEHITALLSERRP